MKLPAVFHLPPEASGLLKKAAALSPSGLHLVGGALRDGLLGRPTHDLDLAATGAKALSRSLADALGGALVVLDEEAKVYRIALGARYKVIRQIDVAEVQGGSIEADLGRRDFTINALALLVGKGAKASAKTSDLIDPRGGLEDLAKGRVRAENEALFKDDPLRLLRAFRIAAELDFTIEPQTLAMVSRLRQRVREPAGERVQTEVMALLARPGGPRWLREMDDCGLLTALFEPLEAARQCAVVYYGAGGVLTHSLDTAQRADYLLSELGKVFPGLAPRIEKELRAHASGGVAPRAILVLTALLHDIAKAETAKRVGGRLRFFGHDEVGAKRAGEILRKLKFSRENIDLAEAVILHHLRPGNLASGPVTDKAVYRFFRDLGDKALPLLLVCWADHASYLPQEKLAKLLKACSAAPDEDPQGEETTLRRIQPEDARKTVHHLRVIAYLLRRLFDEKKAAVPARFITGDDVMKALGIPPGPAIGDLLEQVREAQAVGKVKNREEALELIKTLKS